MDLTSSGYLYVYVTDVTDAPVYFDHFNVRHYRGALLDENHYYPYGLTVNMALSASTTPNRFKYQGKEMQDDLGLNLYDFTARQYDPQIGRFWGIDPASQFPSGYTGMGNDPGNQIDPTGCWAGSSSSFGGNGMNGPMTDPTGMGEFKGGSGLPLLAASGDEEDQGFWNQMLASSTEKSGAGNSASADNEKGKQNTAPSDESTFPKWLEIHRQEFSNIKEAYDAWRNEPGYHKGESSDERAARLAGAFAFEARQEWAAGGYDMCSSSSAGQGGLLSKLINWVKNLFTKESTFNAAVVAEKNLATAAANGELTLVLSWSICLARHKGQLIT